MTRPAPARSTGNVVTNSAGNASFTYTGTDAGTDTITAYTDFDNGGTKDAFEKQDTATKYWVDRYVEVSGAIAPDLRTAGDKGRPTHTFEGFMGSADGTVVGSLEVNSQGVEVCTFTPGAGATFGVSACGSSLSALMMNWTNDCTGHPSLISIADRDAVPSVYPRGGIAINDKQDGWGVSPDTWVDIPAFEGSVDKVPLDRGNAHVVDLA